MIINGYAYALVVVRHDVDGGVSRHKLVGIYQSDEEALKNFNKEIEKAKKQFEDYTFSTFESTKTRKDKLRFKSKLFQIWETGSDVTNYCDISLTEKKLK